MKLGTPYEAVQQLLMDKGLQMVAILCDINNILLTTQQAEGADDARIDTEAKRPFSQVEAASRAMGCYYPYPYLNYAAYIQDPIKRYGNAIQTKLTRVSREYDPSRPFQTRVPQGFSRRGQG